MHSVFPIPLVSFVFIREVLLIRPFITTSDAATLIKAGNCSDLGNHIRKKLLNPHQQTQSAVFSLVESVFPAGFYILLLHQWALLSELTWDWTHVENHYICLKDSRTSSGRNWENMNLIIWNCLGAYEQRHHCLFFVPNLFLMNCTKPAEHVWRQRLGKVKAKQNYKTQTWP